MTRFYRRNFVVCGRKIELLLCVLGDLGTVDELSSVPLGFSSRAGDKAGNGSRNRQGTLLPSGSSDSLQLLLIPLSLSSGSGGKSGNGSRDGKAGNGVLGRSKQGPGQQAAAGTTGPRQQIREPD